MMKLYHYTIGAYLPEIVEDHEIKLATAFLKKGVRAAVWFSTNPTWEETANKMLWDKSTGELTDLSKEETMLAGNGLVRIAIDPQAAPYTWRDYERLSGDNKKMLRELLKIAKAEGSDPETEWRISFNPISSEDWLSIEIWDGSKWNVTWSAIPGQVTDVSQQTVGRVEKTPINSTDTSNIQMNNGSQIA